jgi:hypothetical protein
MSVSAISGLSSAQSTSAFEATQKAALTRLLAAFATGLQNDQSAARIQFLAQQIVAVAQSLGHTVDLSDAAAASVPSNSRVSAVTGISQAEMNGMPPGYA